MLPEGLPEGTGELVYSGPNVMQGYATTPADLARGPELEELRTGDLGVQDDDGVYRVVGRVARFAKVYGLRVDLDGVERELGSCGVESRVLEVDGRLAVFVRSGHARRARVLCVEITALPSHALDVVPVDDLPVTSSGKRDDAPLRAVVTQRHAARLLGGSCGADPSDDGAPLEERIRATYALLLGRPDASLDESFVALRGDSLSFVEANVRLGALLAHVPADWPQRTPRELASVRTGRPARARPWSRWPRIDASVLLRAVAIVLVVGSHTDVWMVPGGAHTLLALAGFSLVRFQLPETDPRRRSRRIARMAIGILGPAVLVAGAVALLRGTYDLPTVLGLNNLFGADTWTDQWRLWFLEAIGWGLLLVLVLLRVPPVGRLERRAPYLLPTAALVLTLVIRWSWIGWEADNPQRYSIPFVWTFLLLGWLAARSVTPRLRLATAALAVVSTVGFFGDPVREGVVLGAVAVMLWVPQVRLPAVLLPVVGVVAASSLWVYLMHWEVYPPIEEISEPLALVASFGVGIPAWWLWTRASRVVRARVS